MAHLRDPQQKGVMDAGFYNMGFDVWGYEIDAEYYRKASERLADHTAQIRMDLF